MPSSLEQRSLSKNLYWPSLFINLSRFKEYAFTSFYSANLKDTDFTDSYLGPFDLKNLCANPSLSGTNPVSGSSSIKRCIYS